MNFKKFKQKNIINIKYYAVHAMKILFQRKRNYEIEHF